MRLMSLAAALVSAMIASEASAAVVQYSFNAKIDDLWLYDKVTGSITRVGHTTFGGGLVSMNDSVNGTFSYNTDASLNPYYQPGSPAVGQYVIYALDSVVSKITFNTGGTSFESGGTLEPILQIANDASTFSGSDIFSFSASKKYDPVMFQSAGVSLFDRTGSAFSSASIPTQLNLDNFNYHVVDGGWVRQSDGNQMHFSATITRLDAIAAVPEPSSYALLLLGLTAVSLAAARRRDSNR